MVKLPGQGLHFRPRDYDALTVATHGLLRLPLRITTMLEDENHDHP
jgi:hypothetical protein